MLSAFAFCFSRSAAFKWFVISLFRMMVRLDHHGVSSFVRWLQAGTRVVLLLFELFPGLFLGPIRSVAALGPFPSKADTAFLFKRLCPDGPGRDQDLQRGSWDARKQETAPEFGELRPGAVHLRPPLRCPGVSGRAPKQTFLYPGSGRAARRGKRAAPFPG